MNQLAITGVDPGLVHTGIVRIFMDRDIKRYSIRAIVLDGIDPDVIRDTVLERTPTTMEVFVEEYRPRSNFKSDQRMVEGVAGIRKAMPRAKIINNTGVKKIVTKSMLEAMQLWTFDQTTHHQDLRAAARIAIYGALKEPEYNAFFYELFHDHVWKQPWRGIVY